MLLDNLFIRSSLTAYQDRSFDTYSSLNNYEAKPLQMHQPVRSRCISVARKNDVRLQERPSYSLNLKKSLNIRSQPSQPVGTPKKILQLKEMMDDEWLQKFRAIQKIQNNLFLDQLTIISVDTGTPKMPRYIARMLPKLSKRLLSQQQNMIKMEQRFEVQKLNLGKKMNEHELKQQQCTRRINEIIEENYQPKFQIKNNESEHNTIRMQFQTPLKILGDITNCDYYV